MSQGGHVAETTDAMCRDKEVEKAPTEEEESNEHASLMQSQSSFLLGMNLVMIMASLTLSDQELLDYEDMDNASAKEQHVKASVSRLKKKKQEFHQLKITDQRTPRIPTRVLNSRYRSS